MTEQSKDKITKIIKALLAKAAGTDNEAEASIFAAKAHEMMERYQIEVSDVLRDDPIDRSKPYSATTSSPSYKKLLWRSLARYYGCKTMLYWTGATTYEIHIIGRESARVTSELMYPFIMKQVREAGRKLAERNGEKAEAVIRDVANALILRLDRLTAEQKQADPAPVTASGKNALVATNAINALMKELYPKSKPGTARGIGTSGDARGAAEGISLHRQTTTNSTKRLT
jgi:hypothetical protein